MATFNATFQSTGGFTASFASGNDSFSTSFGTVFYIRDYDTYEGSYTVKSVFGNDYALHTEGKLLTDDITVQKIPVVSTSNLYGGRTVVIG